MTTLFTQTKRATIGKGWRSRNGLIDRGPVFVLKLEFGLSDIIGEQNRQ